MVGSQEDNLRRIYNKIQSMTPTLDQPLNKFEKHLQKVKISAIPEHIHKVLEIGCGDGSVFENTLFTCDGYDINEYALFLANRVSNYKVLSNNLEDFKIENYDCICLLGILEHLFMKDMKYILNYIKDARAIYITVPNATSFHRKVGKHAGMIRSYLELSNQDIEIGHVKYYDNHRLVTELLEFIRSNGFTMADNGTLGFKFDTSVAMIPYLDRIDALEKTAKEAGLTGSGKYLGAELYLYLTR